MPNLTDHHRRHIIELLEQGRDLPPDYKVSFWEWAA